MQFIDLQLQKEFLEPGLRKRIDKVLSHGQFIMGPEVQELETALIEYTKIKHCITCANGTDALQIALMTAGIGQGDVVFTTAFSFFATAEVISLIGATPYFVDICPLSYNISGKSLAEAIEQCKQNAIGDTKAVIAVNLFGNPANYEEISKVCKRHKLLLIEDGAQSFGASVNQTKACSFGDIATTSFFPAKPLGCYGDGGAIFTNDDNYADIMKSIRVHGKGRNKYDNIRVGLNSRLDTIQAAILLEKFTVVDEERQKRKQIAERYNDALKNKFFIPELSASVESAWACYTVRSKENTRDEELAKLRAADIPYTLYYDRTLNNQPAMKNAIGTTPVAEKISQEVFSIPCHAYLKRDEIQLIIETLLK